jgi:hypothetical protein
MRRRLALAALALVLATGAASCGWTGGGGKEGAFELAARRAGQWVDGWKGEASAGGRVPRIDLPTPPPIVVDGAAAAIRADVDRAAGPLSRLRARVYDEDLRTAGQLAKDTLCEWFAWYVEDPRHTIPDRETFVVLLARAGLGVILSTPVEAQIQEAGDLVRDAIARARSQDERDRNIAMAGVCSLPVP